MKKLAISIVLTVCLISLLMNLFGVKISYGDDAFRELVIKKVAETIDEIFYFEEGEDWKIIGVKTRGKVSPYLIVQVDISTKEAKKLKSKEIKILIGDREIEIGKR